MVTSVTAKQVVDEIMRARSLASELPDSASGEFLTAVADLLSEALPVAGIDPVLRARVALSLASVHGVEIQEKVAGIARFQLTLAARDALGVSDLESVPPEVTEIIRRNIAWQDALLPADHPLQPYNRAMEDGER